MRDWSDELFSLAFKVEAELRWGWPDRRLIAHSVAELLGLRYEDRPGEVLVYAPDEFSRCRVAHLN